jgi:hypothetical protein
MGVVRRGEMSAQDLAATTAGKDKAPPKTRGKPRVCRSNEPTYLIEAQKVLKSDEIFFGSSKKINGRHVNPKVGKSARILYM